MENSFFIFTKETQQIDIERLHICNWEFNNDSTLVEFGFEIPMQSIHSDQISLSIYIPWFKGSFIVEDLFEKLSNEENSRFIFNDYIQETKYLKTSKLGIIHKFKERNELCILPIEIAKEEKEIINININLKDYNELNNNKPNIYFRIWIKPAIPHISIRKKGISKSTIIYDVKINERRNIPEDKLKFFNNHALCKINGCFLFNILPNSYDIIFYDNSSLKNVRTLEYNSFNKYLSDKRVKKDELIVVFNKKQIKDKNISESFSFFSIYSKERIGTAQFSLAILINIFCAFLFFLGSYRTAGQETKSIINAITTLPIEIYISLLIMIATLLYFVWPTFISMLKLLKSKLFPSSL